MTTLAPACCLPLSLPACRSACLAGLLINCNKLQWTPHRASCHVAYLCCICHRPAAVSCCRLDCCCCCCLDCLIENRKYTNYERSAKLPTALAIKQINRHTSQLPLPPLAASSSAFPPTQLLLLLLPSRPTCLISTPMLISIIYFANYTMSCGSAGQAD